MVTVSGAVYANDAGTRSGSGKMDMNVDMDSWTWTWTWTWNARKNDNVDAAMGASRIGEIALARRGDRVHIHNSGCRCGTVTAAVCVRR